jgi:hypothetical protein
MCFEKATPETLPFNFAHTLITLIANVSYLLSIKYENVNIIFLESFSSNLGVETWGFFGHVISCIYLEQTYDVNIMALLSLQQIQMFQNMETSFG